MAEQGTEATQETERVDPRDLAVGTVVRHPAGSTVVLSGRKEDDSGWWCADGSGLDDRAFTDVGWTVAVDLADVLNEALWQFNEAVSLLREARRYVAPHLPSLAKEIADGLPNIQAALIAMAEQQDAWRTAE